MMVWEQDSMVVVFWDAVGLSDGCRVRSVGVDKILARLEARDLSDFADDEIMGKCCTWFGGGACQVVL